MILENVAVKNFKKDLGLVRDKGRIIIVGGATDVVINPVDIFAREITVKGVSLHRIANKEVFETREALYAGVKAGWLNLYIWREFPLEKAADAHILLQSGSGACGKIILTVD